MADISKRGPDCDDDREGERGKRGKRGKRGRRGHDGERGHDGHDGKDGHDGHDGATGSTGPVGATGATGSAGKGRCNCPCADCPDCPPYVATGCDVVKSPYFINVCCNCGPAINQPCVCQPNTRDDGIQIGIQDVGRCVIGTIVLVSAAIIDTTYYLYQIEALAAQGYRVIAVSLRGTGDGDQPYGALSYDIWADDLRQVLDCLGVDDVTLVGHSAGSGTVLHYAARHQACRVGRIVLASTPPLDPSTANPVAVNAFIAAMRTDYPTALDALITIGFFPQVPTPATRQYLLDALLKTRLYSAIQNVTAETLTEPAASVLANDMAGVTVPTLILHGVSDLIAPFQIALQLNAGIPGSTLVPFLLSGHNLMTSLERQMFTDQVADFAAAGTCAMCPPDPNAPPQALRAPAPVFPPTTPADFDLAALPAVRRIVGWTIDGPVFEP